ncbi:hypothetical protein BGW36DRAFT_433400 [Talaromyces proteolyticus]|uniref:Uncharacterized protein n=1 Tax=Talaromyces proteolyticus TaxID=1131652 RepID=A0AAD4PSP0_9EURO|nr:uncharacterized protein BGW36DRAFT_433400 [Talaromyces proteolyticus]KAH8689398.1 hypothetical protein BGW36DRAFT_433400 [Talaromyces proteolyticus]
MAKKGGKKNNKSKNKGGAASKLPDVKNIVSPAHQEEDKLLYGEGTAQDKTATAVAPTTLNAPAAASGSVASPEQDVSTVPADQLKEQMSEPKPAAELHAKQDERTLPVREKGVAPTTEQPAAAKTEGLAAAKPTESKEEAKKVEEEKAKEQPTAVYSGVSKETLSAEKKQDKSALETGAAGAVAEVTGEKAQKAPAHTDIDATEPEKAKVLGEAESKPVGAVSALDGSKATNKEAVDTPLVAPHVKRTHEDPIFVTQDQSQPPKKPRVDESDTSASQVQPAIPGRYPSPSVAGSTVSGADSGIITGAKDVSKPDAAATGEKTEASKASNDKLGNLTGEKTTGQQEGVSTAKETAPAPAAQAPPSGKHTETPLTSQNAEPRARPVNPAAAMPAQPKPVAKPGQPSQEPQEARLTDKANEDIQPTAAQKEAKKGGFMSWIKRKFKSEKGTA